MKTKFSAKQMWILSICVIVYTTAYFCRLNLSAALDAIMTDTGISMTSAGLLQTVFAVVYACGQMVNGAIVDHVNPVRYLLTGLAGSLVCNFLMGFAGAYPAMLALWMANAAFQSMLWTPIVRIVGAHFIGVKERNRANGALSITLIAGHFGAWAISGLLAERVSWRYSFRIPAMIALAVLIFAGAVLGKWVSSSEMQRTERRVQAAKVSALDVVFSSSFLLVLLTCIQYGFIRDCVITWTPTMLARIGREQAISSTAFTLILPLINVAGVMIGLWMRERSFNPRRIVAIMMAAALCCCVGAMIFSGSILMTAVFLGCICAAMYGANTMLTSLIPMEYDVVGKMGLTAGLIDSFIYLGGALAGALAGGILETEGMSVLCIIWMMAAGVSCAMMLRSIRRRDDTYR